jgi:integrase
MSAARQCPSNHQIWGSPTCSSRLSRQSPDRHDFALVAILGLLGLRIFEATSADIADLGEENGHRVLRVCGKGTKIVLVPLPPAVGRAIDRAIWIPYPWAGIPPAELEVANYRRNAAHSRVGLITT